MVSDSDPLGSNISANIRIDVHVDTRRAEMFMVAFSNLRVIPTWPRPADQASESAAPPQVIFVIADEHADQGGQVSYRPVGCAQYPDPAAHAGAATNPIMGRSQSGFIPTASLEY
jgi:hypothetical protein